MSLFGWHTIGRETSAQTLVELEFNFHSHQIKSSKRFDCGADDRWVRFFSIFLHFSQATAEWLFYSISRLSYSDWLICRVCAAEHRFFPHESRRQKSTQVTLKSYQFPHDLRRVMPPDYTHSTTISPRDRPFLITLRRVDVRLIRSAVNQEIVNLCCLFFYLSLIRPPSLSYYYFSVISKLLHLHLILI